MLLISIAITLFLVFDPFGNLPVYASELKTVPGERRLWIIGREVVTALLILLLFFFIGEVILRYLQISSSSLGIAGGIVLFLISIKMIFPGREATAEENAGREPFIVPLAVPLFAGPASIASVILIRGNNAQEFWTCLAALFIAWAAASTILLLTGPLSRLLGQRVLTAGERLMGMILTAVSVEMLVDGGLKLLKRENIEVFIKASGG